MFGLSFWEIGAILAVALIVLGPKKLPELARKLGEGLREFRHATDSFKDAVNREAYAPPERPTVAPGPNQLPAPAAAAVAARSETEAELVPDAPAPATANAPVEAHAAELEAAARAAAARDHDEPAADDKPTPS
jgi:TatA/E family protein of Tat protein translocase